MKFAKELDRELVPEWRVKYLNYKAGKKRVKAVERALRAAVPSPHNTPSIARHGTIVATPPQRPRRSTSASPAAHSWHARNGSSAEEAGSLKDSPAPFGKSPPSTARRNDDSALPSAAGRYSAKEKEVGADRTATQDRRDGDVPATPPWGVTASEKPAKVPDTPAIAISPPPLEPTYHASPPSGVTSISPAVVTSSWSGIAATSPAVAASPRSGATGASPGAATPNMTTATKSSRPQRTYSFSLPAPAMNVTADWSPQSKGDDVDHDDDDTTRGPFDASPFGGPLVRDYFYEPSQLPASNLSNPQPSPAWHDRRPSVASFRSPVIEALTRTRTQPLQRILTASRAKPYNPRASVHADRLQVLQTRQREFFDFLNSELAKIEDFYRQKEEQAGERLLLLKNQLHEMRDRRAKEIADARYGRSAGGPRSEYGERQGPEGGSGNHVPAGMGWTTPILDRFRFAPGPNSQALQQMVTPDMRPVSEGPGSATSIRPGDANRDYTRRRPPGAEQTVVDGDQVPYRIAKRKLKLALQEFHRSLEMLKSYALLNRTAFRKLNKKYDKAVAAQPPLLNEYVAKHVNSAYFVKSDVVDGQLRTVEDLYSRYFERGNRKVAVGKLRKSDPTRQAVDGGASDKMFVNGVMIGTGLVFAIQGLVLAVQLINSGKGGRGGGGGGDSDDDDDDVIVRRAALAQQAGYLLQLYAGYFLGLLLFALFCLDCKVWAANKVNYHFIFEFNPRDQLDWRELAVFPSFFMFLMGLLMWLNFTRYGASEMFMWYPVILVGLTVVVLFFPAPVLYHRSRRWLAVSHWRLLLAGLYPVEFRDFFLGDMYCSLAYAVSNLELFFCLYAHNFDNPDDCNSGHSRLMGFLAVLPPIWRFLQCLRRYKDTRNAFPHLANCGKYAATILTGVALSFYRIEDSSASMACYMAAAILNSLYTSIWDLFMDFSLLQPNSRHRCLRDILAIKQRWLYYAVLVVDPVLRFGWIPYVVLSDELQHSSLVSFFVALAEVVRRAYWALFRVENEHCANVAQYKASRDVPLPYRLELFVEADEADVDVEQQQQQQQQGGITTDTTVAPSLTSGAGEKQQQAQPPQPSPAVATPPSRPRAKSIAAQPIVGVPLSENDDYDADDRHRTSRETAPDDHSPRPSTPQTQHPTTMATGAAPGTPMHTGMRRRHHNRPSFHHHKRGISRILAEAHKQDFEKRRRPPEHDEPRAGAHQDHNAEAHHAHRHDAAIDDDDDIFSESEFEHEPPRPPPAGLTRQATNASALSGLSARLRADSALGRVQEEEGDGGRGGSSSPGDGEPGSLKNSEKG